ncbi:MAG: hypothetical protein PUH82_02960 [Bacteroidales bacterium]|nr:hypothetical protein [Bacteroidales bacterium]MDD7135311.1 hypothetical protein [Bacteroidales bacterium]MDD7622995.1 hypothetical protein [Bacteroidales bacterium]
MAGFIPFAVWPPATVIRVPEYSKMEWQTASWIFKDGMTDSPLNIQSWNGRQRPWIFNEYEAKQTTSILKDFLHRLI